MPIIMCANQSSWNAAAAASPAPYVTYLYEWMTCFEEAYPHLHKLPLAREEQGNLSSILPLFFDTQQRALVSLPFGGWGGCTVPQETGHYLPFIDDYLRRERAKSVALYLRPGNPEPAERAFFNRFRYALCSHGTHYFSLSLSGGTFDDIALARFHATTRKNYRRAIREGVTAIHLPASAAAVDRFYPFYQHMTDENNASTCFPRSLFYAFAEHMAPQVTIFVAQYKGRDVGAAFCFAAFGILTAWFIVDDRQYRSLRPSTLLCATIMQFGIERNLHTFDLGPSSPSDGSFTFKQRFGAEPLPQYQAIKPYPAIARIKQYCKYLLGRS